MFVKYEGSKYYLSLAMPEEQSVATEAPGVSLPEGNSLMGCHWTADPGIYFASAVPLNGCRNSLWYLAWCEWILGDLHCL